MARRVVEITIKDENRDKGKTFVLTEKPAREAERWAARAMVAILNSGVDVPDSARGSGMAGIAAIGVNQLFKVNYVELEPLMDEMMTCVQVKSSAGVIRQPVEEDIEELPTLLQLRKEVLFLHLGFLPPATLSNLKERLSGLAGLQLVPTSPTPSPQPSAAG